MELAHNQQVAGAIGLAPVILCKAGVSAFVCSCHIEDLQASILPDEHPVEKPEGKVHTLRRKHYAV